MRIIFSPPWQKMLPISLPPLFNFPVWAKQPQTLTPHGSPKTAVLNPPPPSRPTRLIFYEPPGASFFSEIFQLNAMPGNSDPFPPPLPPPPYFTFHVGKRETLHDLDLSTAHSSFISRWRDDSPSSLSLSISRHFKTRPPFFQLAGCLPSLPFSRHEDLFFFSDLT